MPSVWQKHRATTVDDAVCRERRKKGLRMDACIQTTVTSRG